jgi:hypothetical protein
MMKWLTAMKAQSPPHFRSLIGDHKFDFFDAKAAEYAAWTVKQITSHTLPELSKLFLLFCGVKLCSRSLVTVPETDLDS